MLTTLTDDLLDAMIDHAENWMDQSGRRPKELSDGRWSWVGGPLWRCANNGLPPEIWHHICSAESDTQVRLRYATQSEAVDDLAVGLMALKVYGPPEDIRTVPISVTPCTAVAV